MKNSVDTITLKRIWNQRIINILSDIILYGSKAQTALCSRYEDTNVDDMDYTIHSDTRREGTILCNKCEIISEMHRDLSYFIV